MGTVATVLLIRHGRTTANSAGTLAGWTPGVQLDDVGHGQVAALGSRIAGVPLTAVVTSPLERCRQTTTVLLGDREVPVHLDEEVAEVRYGDWTGEPLKVLAKDPLWKIVQQHPSNAQFPGKDGESLAAMQARAVAAIRRWNQVLGPDAVYAVVSHGDVIKAVLADALGLHLDLFQRIVVDPASLSVVSYGDTRPFVERMNDSGGDVSALHPPKRRRKARKSEDAAVGGGAGPSPRSRRKP
ncbi:MAG: MSMEG_4193 family putative phosphomutase [Actinobacteria bacterium]|nr:MSMEG_4193 family putative phosphomutase [Actinomycetota bacterium]